MTAQEKVMKAFQWYILDTGRTLKDSGLNEICSWLYDKAKQSEDDLRKAHEAARNLLLVLHDAAYKGGSQLKPSLRFSGGWEIDQARREVRTPSGLNVAMTTTEYEILLLLVLRKGQVLDRATISELALREEHNPGDRRIDIYISRLRSKLELEGKNIIKTVTKQGYMLTSDEAKTENGAFCLRQGASAQGIGADINNLSCLVGHTDDVFGWVLSG